MFISKSHWNETLNPVPKSGAEKLEENSTWEWWDEFEKRRQVDKLMKNTQEKIRALKVLNEARPDFSPEIIKLYERLLTL